MCRENTLRSISSVVFFGSSPRVRGKQILGFKDSSQKGLIPACAGKTLYLREIGGRGRAHPRVCGENPRFSLPFLPVSGSSPRVRGKPGLGGHKDFMVGLIPACAGKTPRGCGDFQLHWAHPRVCGENYYLVRGGIATMGSSPRVRGKRIGCCHDASLPGLIPACAGKTCS